MPIPHALAAPVAKVGGGDRLSGGARRRRALTIAHSLGTTVAEGAACQALATKPKSAKGRLLPLVRTSW
jgi:hypothetical protein